MYFRHVGEQLRGFATKPIEITNNYLGYKLIYYLDYFWFEEEKKSDKKYGLIEYAFSGAAYYVDLSRDFPMKSRKWEKNRMKEYKGTLKHFFQSAYHNSIEEQGFIIKDTWSDLKAFQYFLNTNPTVAYARWLLTERLFYYNKKSKESTYLHFLPDQDYLFQLENSESEKTDNSRVIPLVNNLLVFHFWDSNHLISDARISYLRILPDELNCQPQVIVDPLGNYQIKDGILLWNYLDNHMKLKTSLPINYNQQWAGK